MKKGEKMKNGAGVVDQKEQNEKAKKEGVDSVSLSTAQLNEKAESGERAAQLDKNWKEYLTNHPFNYKAARVKGEIFDKINSYKGKMYCFPIKFGCNVREGDIVMLNQYCEAFALDDRYSVSYEEWIMSEIVGTAELLIYMSNGHGIVFVKEFSVYKIANSSNPELAVTHDDICNACYLEDQETVCRDDTQPFAGQIMGIEDDAILVFVNLTINDHKKWIWDQEAFAKDPYKSV